MAILQNEAFVNGLYAGAPLMESSLFEVFTSAILVNKTADKTTWMTGDLVYSISVRNVDTSVPALPVTAAVFTDTLEIDFIVLTTATLELDGVPLTAAADPANPGLGEYAYNATTGLLTIPLGDLEVGAPAKVISFHVTKAPQ